ncbi:MAG: hypothetical protein K0V04_29380 [Deltaproteobacteria bacterium]|nr:hypothetical protein [Deltaproteobacteria bacterium]
MPSFATVRLLARNDVRLIARDKMLVTMAVFIVVMGVATRYALPAIDTALANGGVMPSDTVTLRFSDTFPMFVAFIALWQAANIPGVLFGFILLGEKEDQTLQALRVTPLPLRVYTGYRVGVSAAVALLAALYLSYSIGWSSLPPLRLLPIALGASLTAPLAVLFYATFASNKIQGLALTKFGGVAGLLILVGFFVPEPWQWLLGVFPPLLVAKSYWMALDGRAWYWLPLLIGSVAQVGLLVLLINRFRRAVSR